MKKSRFSDTQILTILKQLESRIHFNAWYFWDFKKYGSWKRWRDTDYWCFADPSKRG